MSTANSNPASGNLLEAGGIVKDYESFRAVHGVDFVIPYDSFVTILGPSGCGKTTILRMIGGFESVTAGSILLEGESLTDVMPYDRPINTVFQNYALFPHLRVEDNVAFGLTTRGLKKDEVKRRVDAALESVRMTSMARRYPAQLSGGQQQRVALARAFVNEPKLLLLDEPLGALDLKMRRHMQVELKDLQKRLAMSFLYVTHDQEEAFALSDIIIVMNGGRIEQTDTPERIFHAPENTYVADFIGGANLVAGTLSTFDESTRTGCLETEIGTVEAACSDSVRRDEPSSLCFRAEDISIATGECAGYFSFEATVRHVIFQGSSKLVDVRTGNRSLVAKLDHDVPAAVGEPITLGVANHKCRIVHGDPVVSEEIN